MNMNSSSSSRRQPVPLYQNPYNTRRKVISKPLLLGSLLICLLTWMTISFHLFKSTPPADLEVQVGVNALAGGDEQQQQQQSIHEQQRKTVLHDTTTTRATTTTGKTKKEPPGKKQNDAKKKAKKDTHDYRTIKLETPPPKQKHDDTNFDAQILNLTQHNPVFIGREKLVRMLLEMWIDPTQIEDSIWSQVPVWDDIEQVHGHQPVIYGLDSCQAFRDQVDPLDRRVAIAGMFNTGTNLLAILLQHNCAIPERIEKMGRKKGHGMEWQVPWGKHTPAWYRGSAKVKNFIGQIKPEHIMVAVMLRNPHDWMSSMCRHGYTAKWNRTAKNCPNLYDGNTVAAKFGPGPSSHLSLAHMWNDWNGVYYNATFPRLLVRFEDTIFFPKETSRTICTCVGGKLVTPKEKDGLFHYVIDSAKTGPGHGPGQQRNGLIDAWIKYGKARKITLGKSDLEFSAKNLDRDIVSAMHWEFPEIPDE